MKITRRTLRIGVGVIVVIAAAAGLLTLNYIRGLTAPQPLTISYATVPTAKPAGAGCIGDGASPGIAKEFFNLETNDIYVAGGDNAMPDDVWTGYSFRLPFVKNSTRNLLFDGSCFFRSPDLPADCAGDACFTIETLFDYSWLKLTTVVGDACYPDPAGCSGQTVQPGYVSISTIAKCHEISYNGPTIYELADGTGNRYVMHATATGTPDLDTVRLPTGWTLTAVEIDEPLVVLPFGGGDSCYYNIVRDHLVQSYHQIAYASATYPPA